MTVKRFAAALASALAFGAGASAVASDFHFTVERSKLDTRDARYDALERLEAEALAFCRGDLVMGTTVRSCQKALVAYTVDQIDDARLIADHADVRFRR